MLEEQKDSVPSGLFSPVTGLGREQYLMTRLDNELNRAISSEFDLSLFLIKIPNISRDSQKIKDICNYLIEMFQLKDLLFEYKEDSIAAIKINMTLDNALNFADNTDAKMEHITEQLKSSTTDGWMGFDKFLDSNFRKSTPNE